MPITRVHLTAGDGCNWAIDEDLRLVRSSLAGVCEMTSLARAEAVHAGWWVNLQDFDPADLRGKHVICTAENPPFYYITEPEFLKARERVTLWIARSREGMAQFAALGIESRYAAYTFDPAVFHPLPEDDPGVRALVEKWKIPTDKYLIANFHRDSEGSDLTQPKLQKGPDLFLEIVTRAHEEFGGVHVLLAGPRRYWLRQRLTERGVPFTFVGEDTGERDDLAVNTLPRTTLNLLYNLSDLYVVSSRWEGGPQSILESAATRCKIISNRVGLAMDVLEPECLFDTVLEACELIGRDLQGGALDGSTGKQLARALAAHTEPVLQRDLADIYRSLDPLPSSSRSSAFGVTFRRVARRVLAMRPASRRPLEIALLHRSGSAVAFDGFLDRLVAELEKKNCVVRRNAVDSAPGLVLLGSLVPDDPLLAQLRNSRSVPVIGLLDDSAGGGDEAAQSRLAMHRELDDATVLPSVDALLDLSERGAGLRRMMVLAAPAMPDSAGVKGEVCTVSTGDRWAAGRIAQAQADGCPVLYPAQSRYRNLVWFGGLTYVADPEIPQKLETVRAHASIFHRLVIPPRIGPFAWRILRLASVCRELKAR